MTRIIGGGSLKLDTRSMLPVASGTCYSGGCERRAVTFAYSSTGYAIGRDGLIPVCRRHLLVYRIGKGSGGPWQAEDEFAQLRFCRRSRWRWLAQWRILLDQRAALAGRESRGQRRLRISRDAENRRHV
ncbi:MULTISPECIES: hypothetical protein [Microbacterium]|uniref:hypothetical protein n=1 Tax=Microbacterium TaxID=33882 RepID=UPI001C2C38CE|nr:hypothetical protein [Microbacterium paraoxydans]QXE28926.1 hypothetical protein IZR02_11045 [Microbacterium paraoxydans]